MTTITLDHTLFTGLANPPLRPYSSSTRRPEPFPERPFVQPQASERPFVQPPPLQSSQPPRDQFVHEQPPTNEDKFQDLNGEFECGRTEYRAPTTTGLVIGGQAGSLFLE